MYSKQNLQKDMVMLEAWVFDLTILDKFGRVYDLDVDVKVERKPVTNNEDGANWTHGTLYQNDIGLVKHFIDERNCENGTHGTHGTLSENGHSITNSSCDNLIADLKIAKDTEDKTLNNNAKKNVSTDTFGKEQLTIKEQNTDAVTAVVHPTDNDAYSYNVSVQASQKEETKSSYLFPCHYCDYQGKSEDEVLVHSINAHKGKPARPDSYLVRVNEEGE